MPQPLRTRELIAAIGLLVLVACSDQSTGPSRQVDVRLGTLPDGAATLSISGATRIVSVDVDGFGFAPSGSHAVHLHPGTCLDPYKPPSVSFPDVVADASGVVKATTRSEKPEPGGIPKNSHLDIHPVGSSELARPGADATPTTCTDLPDDPTVAVRLYPEPSHRPFGAVTVKHVSGDLLLVLDLSSFVRSTAHAVDVRSGSCRALGAVKYTFDPVTADGDGHVTATLKAANVGTLPASGDWGVVVHQGPEGDSPATLCGDIGPLQRIP